MNAGISEVVLLNDHASVTGGSAAVAVASALGLAKRGVKVTYFAAVGPVAPQLVGVDNLEVCCLGQEEIARNANRLQAFVGGWRNGRAVRTLRQLLAGKDPARTIVHAHGWMKALSPFALAEVTRLGFPLVVTLHDFFIACPNGGFFDHGAGQICRRAPLSMACWSCACDRRNFGHKLWRNVRTVLQNQVLRLPAKVNRYIAVSAHSLERLKPWLPPDVPVSVVRNPVDCEASVPADVAAYRRFVFVGRFETEKGVGLFAEAVRRAGVPATFVGDGALAGEMRRRCPDARFTGWLDRAGIRREIRQARALVFPPLWYETLGLVVIEAAAEGVPAIVADGCAATDYVRPGVNGLQFAHGSADALADAMRRLRDDDELATRLGRAAHGWYWREPWTSERHVIDLMRIYREVAGEETEATQKGDLWHERAGDFGTGN